MTNEEHAKWALSLKIGDKVCDCRYRHLEIAEITEESDNPYDVQLILEDGSCCSAMNCCDSPDHEWKHPTQEEIDQTMSNFEASSD